MRKWHVIVLIVLVLIAGGIAAAGIFKSQIKTGQERLASFAVGSVDLPG